MFDAFLQLFTSSLRFGGRVKFLAVELCKFEGPTFRCLARVDVTDAERGWDPSVYMCVEEHSWSCGRKLAPCQDSESASRECKTLRRKCPPPPAWPSAMSSEGGIRASTCVWKSIRGVAVESLHPAKIQNRHRENARLRNASATPNQGTSHCSPR